MLSDNCLRTIIYHKIPIAITSGPCSSKLIFVLSVYFTASNENDISGSCVTISSTVLPNYENVSEYAQSTPPKLQSSNVCK